MEKTIEEKKDSIVRQLKDFLGEKTAVVGISGGIDSAVVAALCVESVGQKRVKCMSLPYGISSNKNIEDIACLMSIGAGYIYHDIKPAVDCICPKLQDKIVRGNVMARIRMVCLYMLSNSCNGLVIGTTNRSEAEIGYFTKYGDGAVDVEPIASLWKHEVYEMGKLLNIPESIITKAPSANLWEGQTDEGEFGFTYDDIEKYFHALEHGTDPKLFVEPQAADKIAAMIKCNEHKKHVPPAFKI
jgi:NAD+ synthase